MIRFLQIWGALWVLLALSPALRAEETTAPGLDYYLPKNARHDPATPTPDTVLGWRFGEWHLRHHELAAYLTVLDSASDRVSLREYARSYGRRPLMVLAITSPQNHARLDEIRRQHLARIDGAFAGKTDPAEPGAPLIVWMGYGVHGNEPSASQAAVLLAYHLAAARDEATRKLLDRTVILLDPSLNPDGMDRFAEWSNSHRGALPSANRADREHREGWPSGRPNYYWFDLNRDWLPATQPESQGRLAVYHEWMPHLVTDYHEMGNVNRTNFFQPGIPEMVNPIIPARNQSLTARIAAGNAKAMDAIGSLYYTRESFDDFYPGKGSTYADLCGGVGILYEQASSRGFHQDTEYGRLGFSFTIRNQITTSLATLRAADQARAEFAENILAFHREARDHAAKSPVKAHLVSAPGDPQRLDAFRELLDRHHIRHAALAETVQAGDRKFYPSTSLAIPASQPRHHLLTAMMETRTEFGGAIFYDVSAWHLPSAYGLWHAELKELPKMQQKTAPGVPAGTVIGKENPAVAYLIPWDQLRSPAALWDLGEQGIRVWVARDSIDKSRPAGTLVVPVSPQNDRYDPADLRKAIDQIAAAHRLRIHTAPSGLNPKGGLDLGSPSLAPLKHPRVALLTGPGATSTTAGDIWHQFDQIWRTPITMIEAPQIDAPLLRDFDSLILPDASFTSLPAGARTAIQAWVNSGGNLIGIGGGSVSSLAAQDWAKCATVKADFSAEPPVAYADADAAQAARQVKGAIVRATFDATNPLTYGYAAQGDSIALFRATTTFLAPPANPHLAPLRYSEKPLISGFISPPNVKSLRGTAPIVIIPSGSGRTILFADNPVFRGHWHGSSRLLANALFFGPLISASGSGGDPDHQD